MLICRVIGTAVATIKRDELKNHKLLIVRRMTLESELAGEPFGLAFVPRPARFRLPVARYGVGPTQHKGTLRTPTTHTDFDFVGHQSSPFQNKKAAAPDDRCKGTQKSTRPASQRGHSRRGLRPF